VSKAKAPSTKKTWRDSLPIDMLLSAVSVLVVAQSISEIPNGLMNNPVYWVLSGVKYMVEQCGPSNVYHNITPSWKPYKGYTNPLFSDTAGIHTAYFCITIPTLRRVKLVLIPSILNMETRSSETTVSTTKTTLYKNAEDYNLSIQFSYLAITSIGSYTLQYQPKRQYLSTAS
jgi:hypothetical protein